MLKITSSKNKYNFRVFAWLNTIFYAQIEKDYLYHYKSFLYIFYFVIFFQKIVYDTLEYDVLNNNISSYLKKITINFYC